MKMLLTTLMAAAIALPVVAVAADHGRHEGGGGPGHYGGPSFGGGYGAPHYGGGGQPRFSPQGPAYGGAPRYAPPPPAYARPPSAYGRPPGYGAPRFREGFQDYAPPSPGRLRRGQFLPQGERGYVVGDYYRYHLRRPPPGYYWYRSGGDFVLAATASGLVFEVVAGDGY